MVCQDGATFVLPRVSVHTPSGVLRGFIIFWFRLTNHLNMTQGLVFWGEEGA